MVDPNLNPSTLSEVSLRSRIARNFSWTVGLSFVLAATGIGRTILLTKSLTVTGFGLVAIVLNFQSFIGMFLGLRVADLVYRFYPQWIHGEKESHANALIRLGLWLTVAPGLVIGSCVFLAAPVIATRLYQAPELTTSFQLYSGAFVLTPLAGVATPVLRLQDKFRWLVVPQAVGAVSGLGFLALYFRQFEEPRLVHVVAIILISTSAQVLPVLGLAIYAHRRHFAQFRSAERGLSSRVKVGELLRETGVKGTIVQANLGGYLRLAFSPGDTFVLGILSSPHQVGLYAFARTLTSPMLILQDNLQASVGPEVARLWVAQKYTRLQKEVRRYVLAAAAAGVLACVAFVGLNEPVIRFVARRAYLASGNVALVHMIHAALLLMSVPFYPLALMMDRLPQFNKTLAGALVVVGMALIAIGTPSAMEMAILALVARMVIQLCFNVPTYLSLQRK